MVPLPLACSGFVAFACCCPAGAHALLLLALAVALVPWLLAFVGGVGLCPGRCWQGLCQGLCSAWAGASRGPAGVRPSAAQGRRCMQWPLALQQQRRPTPPIPQPCGGAGRACVPACWEAPGAAHNGWQLQSDCAIQSIAWPAFQHAAGGLRVRVSVLDTPKRAFLKGDFFRTAGPGGGAGHCKPNPRPRGAIARRCHSLK